MFSKTYAFHISEGKEEVAKQKAIEEFLAEFPQYKNKSEKVIAKVGKDKASVFVYVEDEPN